MEKINFGEKFVKRKIENNTETARIKERLTRTLGELIHFQTIADGQHNDQIRGLFNYVQEAIEKVFENDHKGFARQEWDDGQGHISVIITPHNPDSSDEETILHPKMAMLIHADVVNAEEPSMFDMRSEEDDLIGRGTLDMKGGLAIGLDLLPELPVGAALIITSDEEIGGKYGAQFLAKTVGVKPEFLIVLDGQKPEHISFGAKGAWHPDITFKSLLHKGGHGSRYEDYSANELGMDLRNALRTIYPWMYSNSPTGTTINIGVVNGGVATNKVAEQAVFKVDMRFPSEEEQRQGEENLHKALQEVILKKLHEVYGDDLAARLESETKEVNDRRVYEVQVVNNKTGERYTVASVDTIIKIPVYSIDRLDKRVQKFISILEEVTGESIKINDKDTGAHDGSKWPDVPAVVYLPKGGGAHTNEERVSVTSLVQTREAIKQLINEDL